MLKYIFWIFYADREIRKAKTFTEWKTAINNVFFVPFMFGFVSLGLLMGTAFVIWFPEKVVSPAGVVSVCIMLAVIFYSFGGIGYWMARSSNSPSDKKALPHG